MRWRRGILWVDEGMRFDTHRLHGVTLTLDDERARPVSSTQPRVHARAAPFEESQRARDRLSVPSPSSQVPVFWVPSGTGFGPLTDCLLYSFRGLKSVIRFLLCLLWAEHLA